MGDSMKVLDGVFGFVVGDALGVPVEFKSREELEKNPVVDMFGMGVHRQPIGTWSDDTSMLLATMDSIIENQKIDYDSIMNNFCLWALERKYNPHGKVFDMGITTSVAIQNYLDGKSINDCGCNGYYDNGNGSLMRILPLSYYFLENNFSEEEIAIVVNKLSSLTHAHSISCMGCYLYTRYVMFLLMGKDFKESYLSLCDVDVSMYDLSTISVYKRVLSGEILNLSVDKIKASGFVVSSLEASIWCNLNSSNYREAVLKAVNLGEDTDTVAALTGALAGIRYGTSDIPENWLDQLVKRDYIETLSNSYQDTVNRCKRKVRE